MSGIDGIFLTHFAMLVGCWVYLLWRRRRSPILRHVGLISTSYVLLTGIDVYTVVVEGYPHPSLKTWGMLVAFTLGAFALTDLLFRRAELTR